MLLLNLAGFATPVAGPTRLVSSRSTNAPPNGSTHSARAHVGSPAVPRTDSRACPVRCGPGVGRVAPFPPSPHCTRGQLRCTLDLSSSRALLYGSCTLAIGSECVFRKTPTTRCPRYGMHGLPSYSPALAVESRSRRLGRAHREVCATSQHCKASASRRSVITIPHKHNSDAVRSDTKLNRGHALSLPKTCAFVPRAEVLLPVRLCTLCHAQ